MKFDRKLEQKILRELTRRSEPLGWVSDFKFDGYTDETVSRHIELAHRKGLIDAIDLSSMDGYEWAPKCLTPAGYEAIDAERKGAIGALFNVSGALFWKVCTAVLTAVVVALVLSHLGLG